ncbi:MAG: branched-chain amino acid ABC transporter permease [Actinobacteria bacterium HGW-Actinobacteria-7]|jgi:4-azaleucine resistance transporter AzlC|nr:MAG: branched-chain amino acid ABC transporter permease [Actinobacteria bacterium HGW-Actinobacteria-7]
MSKTRYSFITGAKGVAPILIGVAPFGLVAGAAIRHAGFGLAESTGMSVIVFAGASQIAATTLFGSGAPLWVALCTALIINARMFIYSVSIAPVLAEAPAWARPILGYMLVDQNYAATMTDGRDHDDVDIVWYYVGGGVALWVVWQICSVAGALLGPFIPMSWGLDFAVPLVFLAMLAPAMKDKTAVGVAVVTGVAAAVLVPLLPLQSGLIVAILGGMGFGAWIDRPKAGESR